MRGTIILLVAVGLFASACSKEQALPDEQKEQIQIKVHSPKAGQEYALGDTVKVAVDLIAPMGLHEYRVRILKGKEELFRREAHTHAHEKELEWLWINNASACELVLVVEATDHNLSLFKEKRVFASRD